MFLSIRAPYRPTFYELGLMILACVAGCGKSPPAAFSHHSEAQRTAQSTIRLFARCGLAGRPLFASCMAVQCRLSLWYSWRR